MSDVQESLGSNPLPDFCKAVISRHAENWPPSESALAHEFVERYSFDPFFTQDQLAQFSATLGIETSTAQLPERIGGFNCAFADKKLILLTETEAFPGGREHTFFHELRELLEYTFRDLQFPTVQGSDLERHAEVFAVQVRMVAALRVWGTFFKDAQNIQARWARWLVYSGIIGLALVHGLGCAMAPYAENQLSRQS
jgi:hypothetical protein